MTDIKDLIEEEAAKALNHYIGHEKPLLLSIAISTKRIADTLNHLTVHSPYGRPALNTAEIE